MLGAGRKNPQAVGLAGVGSQVQHRFLRKDSSSKPLYGFLRLCQYHDDFSTGRVSVSNNPRLAQANLRRRPQGRNLTSSLRESRIACSSESNYTNVFSDVPIEVVKCLEEAENQSLKAVQGGESQPKKHETSTLEAGTIVSSVSTALEGIWTEEDTKNDQLCSMEPEVLMAAAAKVAEALEKEEEDQPGQMYFHMLEPASPVAAPVMIRDFSETIESSDDEEEVVGFMTHVEEKEYIAPPEPSVLEEGSINAAVDVKQPEVVIPEEEEHLLEPGAVASALMVKEVADALKTVEGDKLLAPVHEKESDNVAVQDPEEKSLMEQLKEIIVFAGPALGIWLSGPIMGIIDTSVIGNSSSLELAALGPEQRGGKAPSIKDAVFSLGLRNGLACCYRSFCHAITTSFCWGSELRFDTSSKSVCSDSSSGMACSAC